MGKDKKILVLALLLLVVWMKSAVAEDAASTPATQAAPAPQQGMPTSAPMPGMAQGMPPMPGQPQMQPYGGMSYPAPQPTPTEQPGVQQVSQPATPLSEEEIEEGLKINEHKISLDLKGIDVVELLRILSLKMNKTIVPTKNVSGRLNIFLNNLTFDDALDVIMISQDLACDKKGDIINIMTAGEYEKLYGKKYNEKREFKTVKLTYAKPQTVFAALGQIKSDIGKVIVDESSGVIFLIDIPERVQLMEETIRQIDLSPQTEIFDIKYAKTSDMKTQLTSAITTGPGELFVDDRSSKVVVTDLPEKIRKIKRMVKAFDEETRQVFIEAEIVQVSLKDEFQRGLDWQKVFSSKQFGPIDVHSVFPVASSFTPSPLLTADYLKMIVGTLAVDKYTVTMDLLETYGDTKILSRPRISAVNNTEAKIMVGTRQAYVTQSQSQATSTTVTSESVEFIDVGVKLNVVPTINSDGFITMKIKPEISSVSETLTTALKSVIPIVETSEAETTVKVKDGEMIMIAGLIKDDKRSDISGIPWLSRLPIVGALFGTRTTLKKRSEIIVFLKPRLITGTKPLPGTEMQDVIPPEMIPKDMKRPILGRMISRRVKDISVGPEESPKTLEEVPEMKIKPGGKGIQLEPLVKDADDEVLPRIYEREKPPKVDRDLAAGSEASSVDVEKKMKGLKEY